MVKSGLPGAASQSARTVGWPLPCSYREASMPIPRNRSSSHSALCRQSSRCRLRVPTLGIRSSSAKSASACARLRRASSSASSSTGELVEVAEQELHTPAEVLERQVLVGAMRPGAGLVEAGDDNGCAEGALEVDRHRDGAPGAGVV